MLVLHVDAIIRRWLGYALEALFGRLWLQFGLRRDLAKTFLDAARWLEVAFLVAAVGAGGVILIQLLMTPYEEGPDLTPEPSHLLDR